MPKAKEVHLKKLKCLDTRGPALDKVSVELRADGDQVFKKEKTLKKGQSWSLGEKRSFKGNMEVKLYELQTSPRAGIGSFSSNKLHSTTTKTFTSSRWSTKYQLTFDVREIVIPEKAPKPYKVVVNGRSRYVGPGASDGMYDLFYSAAKRDSGTPWAGKWVQSNEPKINHCGPTAGKNLLYWYGINKSYSDLALRMKTNKWDDQIPVQFFLDPVTAAIAVALFQSALKAGSLTKHVESTMKRYRPSGMTLRSKTTNGELTDLTSRLKHGRPVMVLYSPCNMGLHWAVVTGTYKSGSNTMVRLANGNDMKWSSFRNGWKLRVPDPGRPFLELLSLRSFTMLYYE